MTAEQWPEMKAILARALTCRSLPERKAFVAQCCGGNSVLKDDVDALLTHADEIFADEVLIHELGSRVMPFSGDAGLERLKSLLKHAAEARRSLLDERPRGYGG
jgi:hypothetical protein